MVMHDTVVVEHAVLRTRYCAKLTGEDLSRYLNKTESAGLRKA